jgi:hypothetical protein
MAPYLRYSACAYYINLELKSMLSLIVLIEALNTVTPFLNIKAFIARLII